MSKRDEPKKLSVEFSSDSSIEIRVEAPTAEAESVVVRIFHHFFHSPQFQRIRDSVENFHPAYQSLLLDFDPLKAHPMKLRDWVLEGLGRLESLAESTGALVEIPVQYGGENGPDLEEVARLTGLSTAEVIRLHSATEYMVSFLGFSPGFPYLSGLDPRLVCPRKSSPRLRVPKGSVAIAGHQAGIYPSESPGGWQIIGRTNSNLFDPRSERPSLLSPGDRLKFVIAGGGL